MVVGDVSLLNRWRLGGAAWGMTILLLPLQVIVAMQWPEGYSVAKNAISDLGVTTCEPLIDGSAPMRQTCSPWHGVFNAGIVASGVLMTAGALLLYGRWRGSAGHLGVTMMAISGASVVVVGFTPWNIYPELHDGAALSQAAAQWLAMLLLAKAAGKGIFRRLTNATAVVSILSFIAFLLALEGSEVPVLGFGFAERLSFDTLTI